MMESYVLQAMMVLVALSAWEFIKLGVSRFFKKTVETEYLTVAQFNTQCSGCKGKSKAEDKSVGDALSELRGIILVIALKVGIDEEQMVKLVKK